VATNLKIKVHIRTFWPNE